VDPVDFVAIFFAFYHFVFQNEWLECHMGYHVVLGLGVAANEKAIYDQSSVFRKGSVTT
jgi:hypothetical protein